MSPRERYQADLDRPGFHRDPAQQRALDCFHDLHQRLLSPAPSSTLWQRLARRRAVPVQGLYLWGGPGRGKTYLMIAFSRVCRFPKSAACISTA